MTSQKCAHQLMLSLIACSVTDGLSLLHQAHSENLKKDFRTTHMAYYIGENLPFYTLTAVRIKPATY